MYTSPMTTPAAPRRRKRQTVYPNHVSVYENREGLSLLGQLAEERGLSQAALLRMLIREEAARKGIKPETEQEA